MKAAFTKLFRSLTTPKPDKQFIAEMKATLADGVLTDEERHFLMDRHSELGANGAWQKVKSDLYVAAVRGAVKGNQITPQAEAELGRIREYLQLSPEEESAGRHLIMNAKANVAWDVYLEQLRTLRVPDVPVSNVVFRKGERAILAVEAEALEEKVVRREFVSGSRGMSFRIAKGVSYRVGSSRGYSNPVMGFVPVSTGRLVITTRRIVFAGAPKGWGDPLEKLVSVDPSEDGLFYSMENRAKPRIVRYSGKVRGDAVVAALQGVVSSFA